MSTFAAFRRIVWGLTFLAAAAAPGVAQQGPADLQTPLPTARAILTQDVDFYGGDLKTLFGTSLEGCQNACVADTACQAFTYNTIKAVCFAKSTPLRQEGYAGAVSGRVLRQSAEGQAQALSRAKDLTFLTADDLRQARDLAARLFLLPTPADSSAEAFAQAAREAVRNSDGAAALRLGATAVALSDSVADWQAYARLNLDLLGEDARQREDAGRAEDAKLGAINAYLRLSEGDGAGRLAALRLMAEALEKSGQGPAMVQALRLAAQIAPDNAGVAAELAAASGKYGFRVTDTQVESDSTAPRLCAILSEALDYRATDYTPFVQLPDPGISVEASENQICLTGLSHGERYRFTLREGLPAANGEVLARSVTLTGYVRDRTPAVRFPGRAYILPRSQSAGIPVETVNLSTLDLTLLRVSDRNLVRAIREDFLNRPLGSYEQQLFDDQLAQEVWSGTGDVGNELNRDTTTRLPLGSVTADLPTGIYALRAAVPGADPYQTAPATQWFVVSDIGATTLAGTDGLHVMVRSLRSADEMPGAEVELISRANGVLGRATTDERGYARFDPGLSRGTGASAPAVITIRNGDDDIAFLSLSDPGFDLSDRGVEGREPAPPIDVFLSTERGAYRAGETVFATALARDAQIAAQSGLPLTAILSRPDGVEYARVTSGDDKLGGHSFALPLDADAPRGTWRLALHADPKAPALASTPLLVEDFLPERIDFTLALPEDPLRPGDTPRAEVEARYLFGAPAQGLPLEGEVSLRPVRQLAGFEGYLFGRHDAEMTPEMTALEPGQLTDADGRAGIPAPIPAAPEVTGTPFEAVLSLRVSEGSGRPVERKLTRALAPVGGLIGLRPLFQDTVPEGSEAGFRILALGEDLAPQSQRLRITVDRIETRYQWYQLYGNWNWEPVTRRTRVLDQEAQTTGTQPLALWVPVDWGRYELTVETLDGAYRATSMQFDAGWFAPAGAADSPDLLEMSLDAERYRAGDTARLRVVPRHPGLALVTVLSDRLIDMKAVRIPAGESTIDLPVTDDWGVGAYVTVSFIRPLDGLSDAEAAEPVRAIGLAHAATDPAGRLLKARFDVGPAAPRQRLDVALKIDGLRPGTPAFATIAAVDVGILNLTGFRAPDPEGHYLGRRKLGVAIRDVYGRLIDGRSGAMGQVRSGGDAGADLRRQADPPTEALVAFYQGPIAIGPDGMARTSFDLPDFNGTVRLMGIVWSQDAVGQAVQDVVVRDPVVLTASAPQFLAPGDSAELRIDLTHVEGPAGPVRLSLEADPEIAPELGPLSVTIELSEGGRKTLTIPLEAIAPGTPRVRLRLETAGGQTLSKTVTIPIRRLDPQIARSHQVDLAAGQTLTFDAGIFAEFRPSGAKATLTTGPLGRLDVPGLLETLDRYPYGCTEQVASRAMPLLYFDQVAKALGLAVRDTVDVRIAQAITQVLGNQSANGAFGLWRPDAGDGWLDAYATDFLSRARAKGHAVPDRAFAAAMDNLRNRINYAADFQNGGEDLAYALMVLAREGAASMGDLRYYADVKAGDLATPLAVAQLGAALAFYGDQRRADQLFAQAQRMVTDSAVPGPERVWRVDYGTPLRDAAGVLALGAEAGTGVLDRAALADRIVARGDRPLSTQEALWSLLAARALLEDGTGQPLRINGKVADGALTRVLHAETMIPVEITNAGTQPETISITTFGVPQVPDAAGGAGYALERAYFTPDGQPVDPAVVVQGTRLVTVLTVRPFEKAEARLMVSDPLPAGFEIDNPHLLGAGDIASYAWLGDIAEAQSTEFRSDRFLAAVDWRSDAAFRLAYMVRAITPGQFHHPAALVEDMYRPQFRAVTDSGRVTVTE